MIKGLNKKSNYQDILRFIAIVIMIIDHIGLFLFPDHVYLRAIGRGAFPLFCFFAGYNFHSSPKIHILLYGAMLHLVMYCYVFAGLYPPLNILLTIFIGQIYLWVFKRSLQNFWIGYVHVIILSLLFHITNRYIEYGSIAIAIMILGYIAKHNPKMNYLMALAAMILAFIDTIITFDVLFNTADYLVSLSMILMIYILMITYSYNHIVAININIISRNTLLIYCIHVVILGIFWRYYYGANDMVIF